MNELFGFYLPTNTLKLKEQSASRDLTYFVNRLNILTTYTFSFSLLFQITRLILKM